jgi:hypothetical protein
MARCNTDRQIQILGIHLTVPVSYMADLYKTSDFDIGTNFETLSAIPSPTQPG